MDVVETTLKAVENRNAAHAKLSEFQEKQEEYEKIITELKESLEEAQSSHCKNKEILEVNNFIKNSFNENCQVVKELFGKVYSDAQEVEESLNKINNQEGRLEELYNENEKRYADLEAKLSNDFETLKIKEKDIQEKYTKENSELDQQIADLISQISEADELWKNLLVEHDEQYRTLQATNLQNELLTEEIDNIEKEEEENLMKIQSLKEEKQKKLDQIEAEGEELEEEIRKLEMSLEETSRQIKSKLEIKDEILKKEREETMNLEKLDKQCLTIVTEISDIEEKTRQSIKEIAGAVETNTKLIEECQADLLVSENNSLQLMAEIDQLGLKNSVLDKEITCKKESYDKLCSTKTEISEEIKTLTDDNNRLSIDYTHLQDNLAEHKNKISENENYLQDLQSEKQSELKEIEERMKAEESEYCARKTELENEIYKNDLENRSLQENCEKLQSDLQNLKSEKNVLQDEADEHKNQINLLAIQHEFISKEMKRLEAAKSAKARPVPKPPLKRALRSVPRKRKALDAESDSSFEGEKLSYTEFMARKGILKKSTK